MSWHTGNTTVGVRLPEQAIRAIDEICGGKTGGGLPGGRAHWCRGILLAYLGIEEPLRGTRGNPMREKVRKEDQRKCNLHREQVMRTAAARVREIYQDQYGAGPKDRKKEP